MKYEDRPIVLENGYVPARQRASRPSVVTEPYLQRIPRASDPEDDEFYEPRPQTRSIRRYNAGVPMPIPRTDVREVTYSRGVASQRILSMACIIFGAVLMVILIWNIWIMPWLINWHDTATYGDPRRLVVEANVGHGTQVHPLTRFVGINNAGLIEVIELPEDPTLGGDHMHVYFIAHLGSDRVPVTSIQFSDVNSDGKMDMIVIVNGTEYTLINDGNQFKQQ